MDVIRFDLEHMPEPREGLSLALGNFDGMHRGHQKLFVETALNASADSGMLVFAKPFLGGSSLSSVEDKVRMALPSRLDLVYVLENDESLYALEPEEFIERVLIPLGTKRVVVGEDFRFGKGAKGTPEDLKRHFKTEVIPLLFEGKEKIASSAVKAYLAEGDVEKAHLLLGHPHEIAGKVGRGFGNGHKIGYPTLNIVPDGDYALPKVGVYGGVVYVSGIAYRAMVNIGTNPTIGKLDAPVIEAHLLDFAGDGYGKKVYLSFLFRLRDEKKFASLDELKAQLERDEAALKERFC